MEYLIAMEPGTDRTAWGVVVPDLPDCFSAGDSMEEAIANAKEAIALHLDGLLDSGKVPPERKDFAVHRANPEFKNWVWAIISIADEDLDDKVERINITMPRRVLRVIDNAAQNAGENRSAFLTRAALSEVSRSIPVKITGNAARYPDLLQENHAFNAAVRGKAVGEPSAPWSAKSAADFSGQEARRKARAKRDRS